MKVASLENSKKLYHDRELRDTDLYYQCNNFTQEVKLLKREDIKFDRECVVYPAYDTNYLKIKLGGKVSTADPDELCNLVLATKKSS